MESESSSSSSLHGIDEEGAAGWPATHVDPPSGRQNRLVPLINVARRRSRKPGWLTGPRVRFLHPPPSLCSGYGDGGPGRAVTSDSRKRALGSPSANTSPPNVTEEVSDEGAASKYRGVVIEAVSYGGMSGPREQQGLNPAGVSKL